MLIRQTEDQLKKEITDIERLLESNAKATAESGKCAHAYLKQLLHNRRERLRTIQYRSVGTKPTVSKAVSVAPLPIQYRSVGTKPTVSKAVSVAPLPRPTLRLATHSARAW